MNLSIIGMGYVGLTTAACFAAKGKRVLGVEVNKDKLKNLKLGIPSFHEDGLDKLLLQNIGHSLDISDNLKYAIEETDISFICVGTPTVNGEIDLTFVSNCLRDVLSIIKNKITFHVIVIKSTVVPNSTDIVFRKIIEDEFHLKVGKDIGLCVNPEFLREGSAVNDFMNPDRIVIGTSDELSEKKLKSLYEVFTDVPIISVSNSTAELIKYASNSFFATLISFANEISNISEKLYDTNIVDVFDGLFADRRFSNRHVNDTKALPGLVTYLRPGPGFGGSCFPKDVQALAACSEKLCFEPSLLNAVLKINEFQPYNLLKHAKRLLGSLCDKKVGVLGLSFKSNSDDIRESKSIELLKLLIREKAEVYAHDPMAINNTKLFLKAYPVNYEIDYHVIISKCDLVFVCVDWEEYKNLDVVVNSLNPDIFVMDAKLFLDRKKYKRIAAVGDSRSSYE
jgi:UDPglucose 6-dehydrogenase/GDP-mannose 6-dehydrogenase